MKAAPNNEHETPILKVGLINGYWFFFKDGENNFAVHGSSFSGKESIYVNNKLVSEKRSLSVASQHKFKLNDDTYKVKIHMVSLLRGELHCSLYKNRVLISEESKAYFEKKNSLVHLLILGACIVAGGIFGMVLFGMTIIWTGYGITQ